MWAVVLPVFVALVAASQRGVGVRQAALRAVVIFGVALTFITEVLSAVGHLTRGFVAVAWLLGCAFATAWLIRTRLRTRSPASCVRGDPMAGARELNKCDAVIATSLVLLLVAELVVAVRVMPNNWDSMTYHLARVGHWIDNRSTGLYPTSIDRQLYLGPWAEYAIAHLQLLSLSVRSSNLVQWTAGAITVVATTQIAALLGLDRRGQLLAGLVVATIPMVVLQSDSTGNDLTIAMWVVIAVQGMLSDLDRPSVASRSQAAAAAGLAILTKSTAVLFLLPFAVWWTLATRRRGALAVARAGLVAASLVVALNAPFEARVLAQWHRPLGPSHATELLVNRNPLIAGISNAVRDAGTEVATPIASLQHADEFVVDHTNKLLGFSPSDSGAVAFPPFRIAFHRDEDYVPSPEHVVLIAATLVVTIFLRRRLKKLVLPYMICCTLSYLVFVSYLKWQPWVNRLLLPSIVLWAPAIAFVLRRAPRVVLALTTAVLLVEAFVSVMQNDTRPIWRNGDSVLTQSAVDTMFVWRPTFERPYADAAAFLRRRHARAIGVVEGRDDWEYPLHVLLGSPASSPHIFDVVRRDLAAYHAQSRQPDAVFCTHEDSCRSWTNAGWRIWRFGRGITVVVPS